MNFLKKIFNTSKKVIIDNELLADKIEEVIGQMFAEFRSNSTVLEYSIFYVPEKHSSWFIVIYFEDNSQLKESIKSGFCYDIHSFLLNEMNKVDELNKVERGIFFESDNRPLDKLEYDAQFLKLLDKMKAIESGASKPDIKDCHLCDHSFDEHQLLGRDMEKVNETSEGWIMCPEENCNCFQTWGVNYNAEK